jgi:hypothetical protein
LFTRKRSDEQRDEARGGDGKIDATRDDAGGATVAGMVSLDLPSKKMELPSDFWEVPADTTDDILIHHSPKKEKRTLPNIQKEGMKTKRQRKSTNTYQAGFS